MIYNAILNTVSSSTLTMVSGVGIFLIITLILVAVLLTAKHYLVKSGEVDINLNGKTDVTEIGRASCRERV